MLDVKTRVGSWLASVPPPQEPVTTQASWEDHDTRASAPQHTSGGLRVNRLVALGVVLSFAALQVTIQIANRSGRNVDVGVATPARGHQLVADLVCVILLFLLVVLQITGSVEGWPRWRRLVTLLVVLFLTWFPVVAFGKVWSGVAGFAAGSALILLEGWVALAMYVATIGSVVLVPLLWGFAWYDTAALPISCSAMGIVVFGLARLLQLVRYVNARGGELALFAVLNERTRFAKDLHDLLGFGLSAIVLKAEFIKRLVDRNPGQARDELAEVLDIARQALADVREVANGYRSISLAKESSSVASLLAAAGVNATVEINCGGLNEKIDNVLAIVLREAVTNVIWHSVPKHCTIEAKVTGERVRLLVANDGVPRSGVSNHHSNGSGLHNLSTRLEAMNGQLTAGVHDGWFVLVAEAPLTLASE